MNDFKFACRQLLKSPGFAAVAVLTLALGIGANTAIFSIIDGLLLRPLDYRQSDRLAIIWTHSPGANVAQDWPSPAQFQAVKSNATVFEGLALVQGFHQIITGQDTPERAGIIVASADLFPLLGVQAELGRVFLPDEDVVGKPAVAVLSHGFWRRHFNGDEKVLGRTIRLNGQSCSIVGVMPPDFSLPNEVLPTVGEVAHADVYLPLQLSPDRMNSHGDENYNIIARLRNGATAAQAQGELDQAARRLRESFPNIYPPSRKFSFSIRPLLEQVVGEMRLPLYVLAGAVGCVLLIACANVANLLLARAVVREREMAVRAAIGAGRWRIVRQLLAESALLALAGGLIGLAVAAGGVQALRQLDPGNIPRINQIGIDGRVLAFTSAAAIMTSFLFGLVPALHSSKLNLATALKEGGRGLAGGHRQLRALLVMAQIALSLILAVGAGLLIRSFAQVQQVNPGFAPQRVLSMQITLSAPGDRALGASRRGHFYEQLWERVRRLPGVESAGGVSVLPLSGGISWGGITIEGYNPAAGQASIQADRRIASVGYFEAMKIPLIKGRYFDEHDGTNSTPVAIIDENMARAYWPNADPIGKRFKPGSADSSNPWLTIAGVVANVKQYALDTDSRVAYYQPHLQVLGDGMSLVARSKDAGSNLAAAIAREAHSLEPGVAIYDVKSMDQWLAESLARRRFAMQALGLFAAVAALLAAAGIYGMISYNVAQRTREIGVRMALGAQRGNVLSLVMGSGLRVAVAGSLAGLIGCLAVTRLMSSLLYGVSPRDPWTLAVVWLLPIAIAALASWAPACNAAKVDPMVALRAE